MDWLDKIFREAPSLARVNPFGLVLMAIGVLTVILATKLSPKVLKLTVNTIKVIGLLVCAGGAMLAILG